MTTFTNSKLTDEHVSNATLIRLILWADQHNSHYVVAALRELQERRKADSVPVEINDDMAYAFHHALSDSSPGADEVEEIKAGLRAAFANVTAQPASVVPEAEPVAWTDEEELRDVKRYGLGEIFQYPPDKYADSRRVIPLYRVPPASIVQAQGIEIAINELVALSPRLDERAAETLSMAVAQLRKLVKKQLQAKD